MAVMKAHIVETEGPETQATVDLHIDNPEALGGGGGEIGNATTSKAGLVKKASGVDAVAAADATSTASGETVSPAEFAAVVTLVNEIKAKTNSTLANMKSAGQMA